MYKLTVKDYCNVFMLMVIGAIVIFIISLSISFLVAEYIVKATILDKEITLQEYLVICQSEQNICKKELDKHIKDREMNDLESNIEELTNEAEEFLLKKVTEANKIKDNRK